MHRFFRKVGKQYMSLVQTRLLPDKCVANKNFLLDGSSQIVATIKLSPCAILTKSSICNKIHTHRFYRISISPCCRRFQYQLHPSDYWLSNWRCRSWVKSIFCNVHAVGL